MSIWNIAEKTSSTIRFPKFNTSQGCEFSHDGRFLAVVERKECKDWLGIYATDSWELLKVFFLPV